MIKIESVSTLEKIKEWEIWEKEPVTYSHFYDKNESFYFLQGLAEITVKDGQTYTIKKGDFVTIDAGTDTTWVIKETVRKHFLFF
ncbi:cupin domain-containing protein [Marinomonas sp. 15G1-11]|uniref:Cupin domain-containing protein n=1 Tax=Marinomonas phaeophyticola TaxID=3004091 RepID=A0ABT4JUL9_9GAMM|nr:cupin domain-containing protein [Marinomonas sp. 15G1-11]MCZ2721920.1 cupin domain-containing protein [Marinomonas sp. 15G1-11]